MTDQIDKDYFETNKFELIFTGKSKITNINSNKRPIQDLHGDLK